MPPRAPAVLTTSTAAGGAVVAVAAPTDGVRTKPAPTRARLLTARATAEMLDIDERTLRAKQAGVTCPRWPCHRQTHTHTAVRSPLGSDLRGVVRFAPSLRKAAGAGGL